MKIEKAIELFVNCDTVTFTVTGCGEESYQTIEFENVVEALEKQLNGGWILCSERLPKEDEGVLISFTNGKVRWAFLYLDEWNTGWSFYPKKYVNAWQPLPPAYKEVENE